MTRYREAFTWTRSIDEFVKWEVKEEPLLHVCSGASDWGDITMDKYEPADVNGDWKNLPFERDTFGAVFADPPWNSGYKADVAAFMREALRIAPVAYLMAPWIYGAAWSELTRVWYRQFPGIHTPILLSRYERSRQMELVALSKELTDDEEDGLPISLPQPEVGKQEDPEADHIARALDVGCEYCGARTGLERHTEPRSRRVKFRCVDADACNARELASADADSHE